MIAVLLGCFCLLLPGVIAAKDLAAGVAMVELRPPVGLPMAGYRDRQGLSRGVLDPLHARVLVVEGKNSTVALVTLDLLFVFPEPQLEVIRDRVKPLGVADAIFSASHTHSGPNLFDRASPDEAQSKMLGEVVAGIEHAWRSRVPVRVGAASGAVRIGHNRLYKMSAGEGKMIWSNETRFPTSPVDPTVLVLRIDRLDGSPLAILANYACHGVVLGPENLDYSADYPGEMMRIVESSVPGNPICLFVQGGAGDIDPYYTRTSPAQNGVALMRETGATLAKEVLRVFRNIETKSISDSEIFITRQMLEFKSRWDKEKMLARLGGTPLSQDLKARVERGLKPSYRLPLTVMLVKGAFAFVGIPAEIFVDFQIDLRERVKDLPIVFGGYTNGALGYIPTIEAAVNGGYGTNPISTHLELGAGDRLVDKAVIQLGYWTGKLKNGPSRQ
jgi:hypothetical protein